MATDAGSTEASPDLSALPSVEELAASLGPEIAHRDAVRAARAVIARGRARLLAGEALGDLVADAAAFAAADAQPRLRRVVNASGVIVHTNLGRAPLAQERVVVKADQAPVKALAPSVDQLPVLEPGERVEPA